MGFHKRKIQKGVYGELSKVQEELEEAFDAEEQGQDLMLLIELSDMIGAIEGVAKKYGFNLKQLQKFAELRSQVAIEEELEKNNNVTKKHYKNFTMITTSYNCNKNCPYCIANIDKLPKSEENFVELEKAILDLKRKDCSFDYFVLSGNGEPSLYSYDQLKRIRDIVEESKLFKEKRIQTSGNLFFENSKFNLFSDWIVEITRVDEDFSKDSKICGYKKDYTQTYFYETAKLRVNLVLLKSNKTKIINIIRRYSEQSNVKIIAIKILDNKDNTWITENAIGYDGVEDICEICNKSFGDVKKDFNNYIWSIDDTLITMSVNKDYLNKDLDSLYWYGNDFLNRRN